MIVSRDSGYEYRSCPNLRLFLFLLSPPSILQKILTAFGDAGLPRLLPNLACFAGQVAFGRMRRGASGS